MNNVDLPAFGGPTMATVFTCLWVAAGGAVAAGWHSLMGGLGGAGLETDVAGGFAAERDVGAVDAVDAGIAAWGFASEGNRGAGDEAEDHEAVGDILGKVERGEGGFLAQGEVEEGLAGIVFATDLHLRPVCAPGDGLSTGTGGGERRRVRMV